MLGEQAMNSINIKSRNSESGFTLIEIAIVLVIIGLLLGGVLQGQQLIENSRVKGATNDFNGLAAAIFSYQDRYGRLPGDDTGAVAARGDSWPAANAGDGNGVITAAAANTFAGTGEVAFFFNNLRSAGFIAGNPASTLVAALPQNPFGGLTSIATAAILTPTGGAALNGLKICMGNVSGTGAIALDTQLDDGIAASGRLRGAADAGVPNAAPAAAPSTVYTEDESYTICYRI
ncbi:MAG: prepilin-type N-terminal cleavage/methylation domain-containing protein [Pseudohongiellaceae bacterium]|jgi:prepilin-type N-terminal cleavage/methylation domain-containing protein